MTIYKQVSMIKAYVIMCLVFPDLTSFSRLSSKLMIRYIIWNKKALFDYKSDKKSAPIVKIIIKDFYSVKSVKK